MAEAEETRARRLFGSQVKRLRKDRGWTQADLAQKADLSLDMIGRLERGTAAPSFATIGRIAQRFDVPIAALFGGTIGKGRAGERSRKAEAILTAISGCDALELDRVHRVILAAIKH